MTLRTAHRILISTAVVFFFGLGLWGIRNYFDTGNLREMVAGVIYLIVAVGFGFYLGSLKRWLK
jgi:hypothetical protein